MKLFLQEILETLQTYTAASSLLTKASILRKIIAFNRPRLQCYVRKLSSQIGKCLETPSISTELSDRLSQLQDLALKADIRELEESECKSSLSKTSEGSQNDMTDFLEVFQACTNLMLFIKDFSKSPAYRSLQEKAGSDKGERLPWAELRHAAGRLLSYFQASKTLMEARKKWEPLFHDFEVVFSRSSTPLPNPINNKRVNAEAIIGRMLGDEAQIQAYRADVEELQKFRLDFEITEQVTKSSFKPLVHAEVLIHQSMLDEFGPTGPHSSQFFSRYSYIGSSKPTCRLCDYYFAASASGIDVRETHRNLYINWRVPDVYSSQGDAATKRREQILNRMLERIRADTLRTLSEKVPERKKNDSNTDSALPALNHGTSVDFDGGWQDADLCQLDLRDSAVEASEASNEPSSRADSGFDGDDDEGGARLW